MNSGVDGGIRTDWKETEKKDMVTFGEKEKTT